MSDARIDPALIDAALLMVSLLVVVSGVVVVPPMRGASVARALSVLVGATLLVTGALRAVPGDPVAAILGEEAPAAVRDDLARALGLEDESGAKASFAAQYARFARGAVSAVVVAAVPPALGGAWLGPLRAAELRSLRNGEPVRTLIGARAGATFLLALAALAAALALGVPFGALAAWRGSLSARNSWGHVVTGLLVLGAALPRFVLGPALVFAFGLWLRVLPVSGDDRGLSSLVLPALTLALPCALLLARLTHDALREALTDACVTTARASGLPEWRVVVGHALRRALTAVVTLAGQELTAVIGGAVVVEKIFAWPGLGMLLLDSIRRLDLPVVQAIVLYTAVATVVVARAAELVCRVLDPRLRDAPRRGAR